MSQLAAWPWEFSRGGIFGGEVPKVVVKFSGRVTKYSGEVPKVVAKFSEGVPKVVAKFSGQGPGGEPVGGTEPVGSGH